MARGKLLIGIPGYPVSALITAELVVKPVVYKLQGIIPFSHPIIQATVTRKMPTPMGQDEYVRVTLGRIGERMVATPLSRNAGVIMSLVRADGIIRIPDFHRALKVAKL